MAADEKVGKVCSTQPKQHEPVQQNQDHIYCSVSELKEYPSVYKIIDAAAVMIWNVEQAMHDFGFLKKDNHSIASFHQTLLDLAAYSELTQGVFMFTEYVLNNRSVYYFLETGRYIGFMHNKCRQLLCDSTKCEGDLPLLYRVHTPSDIEQRAEYIVKRGQSIASKRGQSAASKEGGKKNRTSQIYRKKMAALQSALRTILLTAKECNNDEFRLKSLFVHVMKCNAHDSNPEHRYTHSWNLASRQDVIEEALSAHSKDGPERFPFCEHESLTEHSDTTIPLDVQFDVLSSLPNYHWGQYPLTGTTKLSSLSTHVSLRQHFAFQPPRETSDASLFLPLSIRNRLIYLTKKCLLKDCQRLLSYHCRQLEMNKIYCDGASDGVGPPAKRARIQQDTPE